MDSHAHHGLRSALRILQDSIAAAISGSPEETPRDGGMDTIDRAFKELQTELDLVLREHAGLAEDLLRAYEQLGIVFEVTHKLSTVRSESQVVRLFIDSLRITYPDNIIASVELTQEKTWWWNEESLGVIPEVREVLEESVGHGRVSVRTLPEQVGGVLEIMSAPVYAGKEFVCAIVLAHGSEGRSFEASDMSLVEALVPFCGDIIRNYRLSEELRQLSMNLVRALVSAIDQKDAYTSGHSTRVGYYARLLGAELGLSGEELQMLEWSALLHDVGKIGIRDDVLKKTGRLTEEEFEHIKEHPIRSHEVVCGVPQLKQALDGVRNHHERFDGKGYPDGLVGRDIPLQARIVQVADIFDALTTTRSYRSAFSWEKALSILEEESGSVCDPELVAIFVNLIRKGVAECNLVCPVEPPSHRNHGNPVETRQLEGATA